MSLQRTERLPDVQRLPVCASRPAARRRLTAPPANLCHCTPSGLDLPEPLGPMSTVAGPRSVRVTSRSERKPLTVIRLRVVIIHCSLASRGHGRQGRHTVLQPMYHPLRARLRGGVDLPRVCSGTAQGEVDLPRVCSENSPGAVDRAPGRGRYRPEPMRPGAGP